MAKRPIAGGNATSAPFVNRLDLLAEFIRRVDTDPPASDVLFLHGEGGIGKRTLLVELRDRYCARTQLAPGQMFPTFLKTANAAPLAIVREFARHKHVSVPTAFVDFHASALTGAATHAVSALRLIRHQLGLPLPYFQATCLLYLKVNGWLTQSEIDTLFPGAGVELAATFADQMKLGNALASALGLLADGTAKAGDVAAGALTMGLWKVAASKGGPRAAEWFARRRLSKSGLPDLQSPSPDKLYEALPIALAEDINAHLGDAAQSAPRRIVLLFGGYDAFFGSEHRLSAAERRSRDSWFQALLRTLTPGKGVVIVVAGRNPPDWETSIGHSIRRLEYLTTQDAREYLKMRDVNPAPLRDAVARRAEVSRGHVQPLLLALLADACGVALARGHELDLGRDDDAASERERNVVDTLLADVGGEMADAITTLAACRRFDRDVFMAVGDRLRFNPTDFMWRTIAGLSCVMPAGDSQHRMHALLRRFLGGLSAPRSTHEACRDYFAQDPARVADVVYHEAFFSSKHAQESWTSALDANERQSRHERCTELLDVRAELLDVDGTWVPLGLQAGEYLRGQGRYDEAVFEFRLVRAFARIAEGVVPLDKTTSTREFVQAVEFVATRTPQDRARACTLAGYALDRLGSLEGRRGGLREAQSLLLEAIEQYSLALEIEPNSGSTLISRGASFGTLGDVHVAFGERDLAEKFYRSAWVDTERGHALGAGGAVSWTNVASILRNWADLHGRSGGYSSASALFLLATAAYANALEQNPNYLPARIHRVHAYSMWALVDMQGGTLEDALEHATAASRLAEIGEAGLPDLAESYDARGLALSTLATIQSQRGVDADDCFREAIEAHRRAVELAPSDVELRSNYGAALVARGKTQALRPKAAEASYGEATAVYDEAAALNARNAKVQNGLGLAHLNLAVLRCGRGELESGAQSLDQALASFDRTIVIAPQHWEAHNGRGFSLAGLAKIHAELVPRALELLTASNRAFVASWVLVRNADSLYGQSRNRLWIWRSQTREDACQSLQEIAGIIGEWKSMFPWDQRAAEIELETTLALQTLGCKPVE